MTNIAKKILKIFFVAVFIFLFGGLGGVTLDRYIFPKLDSRSFFSGFDFIKKSGENVTIIEKTEQITVQEEKSANEIAASASTTVVDIISIKNSDQGVRQEVFKNGTGIIITGDGLIVTYRDVIFEENAFYKALVFNGSVYDADLIGVDNFNNLAYLKIDASNLPVIPFADSDNLIAGKKIIAISSSEGEYQTMFSGGILSGADRTFNLSGQAVAFSDKLEGVLETDFAQSDKYVGGAAINYSGELIGISGSLSIGNEKKYFQIPANEIKSSMVLALENKLKTRAKLGAYYKTITRAYAVTNGLKRDRGALVYSASGQQGLAVLSGSAAEKAGIKIGDIIIAVDDQEINLDNPLPNLLSRYQVGDKINLLIDRNGKEIKIEVEF